MRGAWRANAKHRVEKRVIMKNNAPESEQCQLTHHIAMVKLLEIAEQDIREGRTFTYEQIKDKLAAKKRARKAV